MIVSTGSVCPSPGRCTAPSTLSSEVEDQKSCIALGESCLSGASRLRKPPDTETPEGTAVQPCTPNQVPLARPQPSTSVTISSE